MPPILHIPTFLLLFLLSTTTLSSSTSHPELNVLMQIKDSLDPDNRILTSWTPKSDPCSSDSFDGVACDENGLVANISLVGKRLQGKIPPAIGKLKSLTGLYLHFNDLNGEIPVEVSGLSQLRDLYLNMNSLSGLIPPQLGNMTSLQVMHLCCNKLTGSIPTQLGSLSKLNWLILQSNQLTGAIPASLGDLALLTRLDLSFNKLFGSVPVKLANASSLEVLDIRNNSLSGNVPSVLKRLNSGFQYENNERLCGSGFVNLRNCEESDGIDTNRPEPFRPNGVNNLRKEKPQSVDVPPAGNKENSRSSSSGTYAGVVLGVVGLFVSLTVTGLFTFIWYRRRKQKIGNAFDSTDGRLSTDQMKEVCRRSSSPLISLEYSNGWDPLAKGQIGIGFSQEVLESFIFNLEEVERATQCFSETNLLGRSNFSSVYKGLLRDGTVVAIKCIAKTSCTSDEAEFLKGLKILTSVKHDNLVRLRGFCCSKGRGECFLIYEFVPNGTLLQYLDVKEGGDEVLDWPTRISIINGIAKGIGYLHGKKPGLVHQNLSAEKVLIDRRYKPFLSDSGLHKLLADDIVFSMLKASAAMGYLAPEYTTTGRFTDKSDIYAFGMILFQILTGKQKITHLTRLAADSSKFEDLIDPNLKGKYSETEAAKLARVALLCTHEAPIHRPSIDTIMLELNDLVGSS